MQWTDPLMVEGIHWWWRGDERGWVGSGRLREWSGTAGPGKGGKLVKRTRRVGKRREDEHLEFGRVPEMERRSER